MFQGTAGRPLCYRRGGREEVEGFTEAAIRSGLMESDGSEKEGSFMMGWEAIGGSYVKERNRTRRWRQRDPVGRGPL